MKGTIEKLKIKLVYEVTYEMQTNMFTGRAVQTKVPAGDVHIFQIVETDGFKQTHAFAFCGKERAQIGEETDESDKRPNNLPMCKACEAKWKDHPDSPWAKWEKGRKI